MTLEEDTKFSIIIGHPPLDFVSEMCTMLSPRHKGEVYMTMPDAILLLIYSKQEEEKESHQTSLIGFWSRQADK
jgi:hypothetical protein